MKLVERCRLLVEENIWIAKGGQQIKLTEMTEAHLVSCVAMFDRRLARAADPKNFRDPCCLDSEDAEENFVFDQKDVQFWSHYTVVNARLRKCFVDEQQRRKEKSE